MQEIFINGRKNTIEKNNCMVTLNILLYINYRDPKTQILNRLY